MIVRILHIRSAGVPRKSTRRRCGRAGCTGSASSPLRGVRSASGSGWVNQVACSAGRPGAASWGMRGCGDTCKIDVHGRRSSFSWAVRSGGMSAIWLFCAAFIPLDIWATSTICGLTHNSIVLIYDNVAASRIPGGGPLPGRRMQPQILSCTLAELRGFCHA